MLYTDNGRITQAAKLCKECAELYENEEVNTEGEEKSSIVLAIESYEQASELFGMEDAKSQSSQCLAKVAELCSGALEPPDLVRAAGIYDDLGRRCLDSNLLKFNAKGYFLQATLCHLASGDMICGCSVMNVGLMHVSSKNSPTSLSSRRAAVRGALHSTLCFTQRASSALLQEQDNEGQLSRRENE